jgi:hypothetical protein
MPKFGAASLATLAGQEVGGYWQWSGYQGTQPRFWLNSNPGHATELTVNVSELQTDQRALAIQALSLWQDVANIHFTLTNGKADITYNDFTKSDGSAKASTSQTTFFDPLTGRLSLTSATVDGSRNWRQAHPSAITTISSSRWSMKPATRSAWAIPAIITTPGIMIPMLHSMPTIPGNIQSCHTTSSPTLAGALRIMS